MAEQDVRWKQRHENFKKSVANLSEALSTTAPNKLEKQGIIKAFELAYELAWKTLQDYLAALGYGDVVGPKPVIRRAFESGVISNGDLWNEMHQARNESAHIYDEQKADNLEGRIRQDFILPLSKLADSLEARADE